MEDCRRLRGRRGQARLVEIVLATIVLTVTLVTIMNLATPLRSIYLRETSDLRRVAYNILNDFGDARIYENIIIKGNLSGSPWENELRLFISTCLPPQVIFKVDIYVLKVYRNGTLEWVKLNKEPITNVADWDSINLIEAESVTYTYVCIAEPDEARGTFLKIELTLGYGG